MSETNQNDRGSFRHVVPKALLLSICFSLSFIPTIPPGVLKLIPPEYEVAVQVMLPYICDQIQVELWRPFQPILDHASFNSLIDGQDPSNRRIIRKSDSVHAILKGLSLKVAPTAVTSTIVIRGIGFSFWSAFLLTIALLFTMGAINFWLFLPLTKKIQKYKRIRDDNVENGTAHSDMQTAYTASLKTNAIWRGRWNIFLTLGIIMTFLFKKDKGNYSTYLRLAHQIRSLDEAYEKSTQSFPKAQEIIDEMKTRDGIIQQICKACMQTTKVKHMPLYDVEEFSFLKGGLCSLLGEALTKFIYNSLFETLYRGAGRFSEPLIDLEQGDSDNYYQEPILRPASLYLGYATI